jgi:hypothetical protein
MIVVMTTNGWEKKASEAINIMYATSLVANLNVSINGVVALTK